MLRIFHLMNDFQDKFDLTIGRLDNILSLLVNWSKYLGNQAYNSEKSNEVLDLEKAANIQTLKHHAEDMISAGESILSRITPANK